MSRLTVAVACALIALVALAAAATAAREAMQPLRFASAAEEAAFHGMLFSRFETQYNKRYVPSERAMRYRNFVETVRAVEAHNANTARSYDMGLNEWSDMSEEEFARVMLVDAGEECSLTNTVRMSALGHRGLDGAPASVDWREKGVVTPVKNQGRCGSCWSFSSTGVTESAYALATGKLISLSEQQLIDCSRPWGNHGCSGGLPSYSNNYLLHIGGIASEKEYPYQSGEGDDSFACRYKPTMKSAYISSSVNITQFDEKELQIALLNHGPVSVAFQVVAGFKNYAGGVYTSTVCESTPDKMNHGVLAVGFGVTAAGEKYYIVKNSWGESFGLQGYFWIARDQNNMCGIATCASFPVVKV